MDSKVVDSVTLSHHFNQKSGVKQETLDDTQNWLPMRQVIIKDGLFDSDSLKRNSSNVVIVVLTSALDRAHLGWIHKASGYENKHKQLKDLKILRYM